MIVNITFGVLILCTILTIISIARNADYVPFVLVILVVFAVQSANYMRNETYIKSKIDTLAPTLVTYIDNHSDTTTSDLNNLIEDPNLKIVSFNIDEQYGRKKYNIEIKCDKHIFPYTEKYTF